VIAALLTSLVCSAALSGLPLQTEKITEVRIHGNATLSDDAVIALAGVVTGGTLEEGGLEAIEKRLKDSDRFDDVQVRKRYRTLDMDEVAIVIVVHEKPGLSPSGKPPSTARKLRGSLMVGPILDYEDGYGWTYGARLSAVNIGGRGTRLSVPFSGGGTKKIAIEADRTFRSGPLTRLSGSFGTTQRENPHYEIDDRRTEVQGRAEHRLFNALTLGGTLGRTKLTFEPYHDQLWTAGADVTLDTRRDPMFPSDAILASAGWSRINPISGAIASRADGTIDRYRLDGRGYKRLYHQIVFAARAQYDTATPGLPPYEQYLLGGPNLRGVPAGSYVGDKRLVWSTEIRVPFSAVMSTGRAGADAFLDGGKVASAGQPLSGEKTFRGAGGGLFLIIPMFRLNLDVAHSLDGHGTRVHFGMGFSF